MTGLFSWIRKKKNSDVSTSQNNYYNERNIGTNVPILLIDRNSLRVSNIPNSNERKSHSVASEIRPVSKLINGGRVVSPLTDNDETLPQRDRVKSMSLRPENRTSLYASNIPNGNERKSYAVINEVRPASKIINGDRNDFKLAATDEIPSQNNRVKSMSLRPERLSYQSVEEGQSVKLSIINPLDHNSKTHRPVRMSLMEPVEPMRQSMAQPLMQVEDYHKSTRQSLRKSADVYFTEMPMRKTLVRFEDDVVSQRLPTINPQNMFPKEGQTRQSVAQPFQQTENSNARKSILLKPMDGENNHHMRVSMGRPFDQADEFPIATQQPLVYAMTRTSRAKRPSVLKRMVTKKKDMEESEDSGAGEKNLRLSKRRAMAHPEPAAPTRGRTTSILQQSVKSLTSSKDDTPVAWKNIRLSRETDVFSADVKRKNEAPLTPGYVNMEKGRPMLVSELLSPITSLFVSDLKDQIPKDPLTKPKESNNWVKPRNSTARVVQPVPKRPPQTVPKQPPPQIVPKQPPPKYALKDRQQSKAVYQSSRREHRRHDYDDEGSSSSSADSVNYRRIPNKPYTKSYHKQAVYAAQMPEVILPNIKNGLKEIPTVEGKIQNIEDEDTLNILCHPPENSF